MPFGVNELLYGGVIPALAAGAIFIIARRALPEDAGRRYAPGVALVLGFLLGYQLLSLGPWAPGSHWHWLPYVLLMTAVVGPTARAAGISLVERALLFFCAAVVAAWLLVPSWDHLEPSRTAHMVAWVAFVVVSASLLEALTSRASGALLPVVLTMTLAIGAVLLALSESLRFASILIAGFGAMAGIAAVASFDKRANSLDGMALPFTVLVCGMMLVGRVNSFSSVPLASYVLVPIAPLLLWLGIRGPLARLSGWKRAAVQLAFPLAACALALILAAIADWQS